MLALLLLSLQVAAVQISTQFIQADLVVPGTHQTFDDTSFEAQISVASWLTANAVLAGCVRPWELMTETGAGVSLYLCRDEAGVFRGCYDNNCAEVSCDVAPFVWEFVSVAASLTELTVCRSTWSARSLVCSSAVFAPSVEVKAFTRQGVITVSAASNHYELFELQVEFGAVLVSDLQARSDLRQCHSVCLQCTGPAYNACLEFIPIVELLESWEDNTSPARTLTEGSPAFKERIFRTVTQLAYTGWMYTHSLSAGWCEIIRFSMHSCNMCSETSDHCRIPALFYNTDLYAHSTTELFPYLFSRVLQCPPEGVE
jgi:hypothetical protein